MTSITIVCGLPGTGKTTFAEALAKATNAVHLNTDRIRHAMGRKGQYSITLKTIIYESLLRRTREAILMQKNVVIDGTFYKQKLRKPYLLLSTALHVPIHWIELTASDDTVQKRVAISRPYTEADFGVYQKIKQEFDPITFPHLVLNTDLHSVDEMVKMARDVINTKSAPA